jgi:biopolymer transport protein TolR
MALKRRTKKHELKAEINVVPYIDVMLVLLVIFMITAPLLTQGVKVNLPKTTAQPLNLDQEDPLIISIKKDGTYYLNTRDKDDQETASSLEEAIKTAQAFTNQRKDMLILVRGDKQVEYGVVAALMAGLQNAGAPNVGLITDAPDPSK